ncbi:3-deoxy-D-manno-octulosonate cytidylyltransferase [Campylobacter blaseri]|nr:3-deoxy-D-manno-octulosonate cytidylyltransferase [Campylobacter blaseri]
MFIATANVAKKVDDVLIAVDDEKVLKIANDYGFKAVMTKTTHESGTDRINEAVSKMGLKDSEVIINLQADEPFFEGLNLTKFKEFAMEQILNQDAFMASAYKYIEKSEADNPNLVKVVVDENSTALYFSRSKIPFDREPYNDYKGHIGIYAYSVKTLMEFCDFSQSKLEKTEKLEQLRALSNGKKISMLKMESKSIGIDTKEDLEKALKVFKKVNND